MKVSISVGLSESKNQREMYTLNAYIRKEARSQLHYLSFHFNKLKKEQNKSKASRRKKIIDIRTEINKIKNRKSMEKVNQTESWFFEKSNKIDTDGENWENKQITNIRMKKGLSLQTMQTLKGYKTTTKRKLTTQLKSFFENYKLLQLIQDEKII